MLIHIFTLTAIAIGVYTNSNNNCSRYCYISVVPFVLIVINDKQDGTLLIFICFLMIVYCLVLSVFIAINERRDRQGNILLLIFTRFLMTIYYPICR